MNNLTRASSFVILISGSLCFAADDTPPQQRILDRYREFILTNRTVRDAASLRQLAAKLSDSGTWPDIDYKNQGRAYWNSIGHLNRVRAIALAVNTKGHPLHESKALTGAVLKALDAWFERRASGTLKPPSNFWEWIGEPRVTRDILVLMNDRVKPRTRERMIDVLGHAKIRAAKGANLMWLTDVVMHRGALTKDADVIAAAARKIAATVHVSRTEGIKEDWSFHQHGAKLQAFHYGKSFLADAARVGWQLRGTPWAFSKGTISVLANYTLEGLQWMCRGVYTVPSTMDRMCSRKGSLRAARMASILRHLRDLQPERSEAYDAFLARQEGRGKSLIGHRHFPLSDFTTYHRPNFSFFLKTVSNRTGFSESINGENLHGHFLNWGDHYLLREGAEYAGLQPVWNWYQLPGLTAGRGFDGRRSIVRKPFTGAVSNGKSGLTGMDVQLSGKAKPLRLSCRKVWACHEDMIVALVADLRFCAGGDDIQTSLEQCHLAGDVTVGLKDKAPETFGAGEKALQGVRWVHHDSTAYVPLGVDTVSLKAGPQKGSWKRINARYSGAGVTEKVFSLWVPHGKKLDGWAFGYAILPGVSVKEAAKLAKNPPWKILRNDSDCQALRFSDGVWMAAFFSPGELKVTPELKVTVNSPCLLLHDGKAFRGCDPTNRGMELTVTLSGKDPLKVTLPKNGQSGWAVKK